MRQVMAERPNSYVPPASGLESRFAEILRRAGEPPMDRQVNTGDAARWIGRVDFIDRELSVIAEVQSERFHASLIDRQLDAERIADLEAAGFRVIEISETEIWQQPSVAVDKVRTARADARLRRRAA
jgi:very-short-patch-repair endonuclease